MGLSKNIMIALEDWKEVKKELSKKSLTKGKPIK